MKTEGKQILVYSDGYKEIVRKKVDESATEIYDEVDTERERKKS